MIFRNSFFGRMAVACALLSPLLGLAQAQAGLVSYSLQICESLAVLKQPDNLAVKDLAAMDTQHALMAERSNPYMALSNTSDTADIIQFTITMGAGAKADFDWAKLVEAPAGVTATFAPIGTDAKSVSVTFAGFDPGETVYMRMGLYCSDAKAHPFVDYRSCLSEMKMTGLGENGEVAVVFQDGNEFATLTDPIPTCIVTDPTATSLVFPCDAWSTDHVNSLDMSGQGQTEPVPEPSTMVLLGLGLLPVAVSTLKRRRRA